MSALLSMGIPHAVLMLYMHPVLHTKEDENSSVSEQEVPMSLEHDWLEQAPPDRC